MSESDSNLVAATLKTVCEKAREQGLDEFILIGGNAVIAHGVPRFTRDIDFVVPERHRRTHDTIRLRSRKG